MQEFNNHTDSNLEKDLDFYEKSINTLYISRTDTFREKIVQSYQDKVSELADLRIKYEQTTKWQKKYRKMKYQFNSLLKENEMLKNQLFSSEQVNLIKTFNLETEVTNFREKYQIDFHLVEDLQNQNKSLTDQLKALDTQCEAQKFRTSQAFEKLAKLQKQYELVCNENHIFRKFYQKNVLEFNKRDIYEREVDEIYSDFNQGLNLKDHFILNNMGKLEETVESFTYCKSKILRDFINKDL
eukprot:403373920